MFFSLHLILFSHRLPLSTPITSSYIYSSLHTCSSPHHYCLPYISSQHLLSLQMPLASLTMPTTAPVAPLHTCYIPHILAMFPFTASVVLSHICCPFPCLLLTFRLFPGSMLPPTFLCGFTLTLTRLSSLHSRLSRLSLNELYFCSVTLLVIGLLLRSPLFSCASGGLTQYPSLLCLHLSMLVCLRLSVELFPHFQLVSLC